MNGGTPFCPRKRPLPSLRGYNLGASAGRGRCQPTIPRLLESYREPSFPSPTSVTTPPDLQRPPDFSRRTALSTESVQEPAATTISRLPRMPCPRQTTARRSWTRPASALEPDAGDRQGRGWMKPNILATPPEPLILKMRRSVAVRPRRSRDRVAGRDRLRFFRGLA